MTIEKTYNFPNWSEPFVNNSRSYLPEDVKSILQIGVWTGDFTEWLLNNRNIEIIDDVDIWVNVGLDWSQGADEFDLNEVEEYYDSRFSNNNKVVKHKMTSDMFFATRQVEEFYDFVIIDGSHATIQTALDGINGYRLLKVGGILAFDDYHWHMEEDTWLRPKTGIDSVLSLLDGRIEILYKKEQVWLKKIK